MAAASHEDSKFDDQHGENDDDDEVGEVNPVVPLDLALILCPATLISLMAQKPRMIA
jgi:hypothetical protein